MAPATAPLLAPAPARKGELIKDPKEDCYSQLSDSEESEGVSNAFVALRFVGPGMLVCLADTDAGCLIVAGQSGARWGYSLLLLQLILIPILFLAQELTVRLGVYTRKGHTACIREQFGPFWAWFSCAFLVIECVGAIVSEMSGVASVMELWGCSQSTGTLMSAAIIVVVVVFCDYRQVETLGVIFGLFELAFVVTMVSVRPPLDEVLEGLVTVHTDAEYVKLVAANLGAVIMPWMIYFQQSAVVARKLVSHRDLVEERTQTMFGSALTQLVMIGALVTMAATAKHKDLQSVRDIQAALEPTFGFFWARLLLSFAFIGGSVCAAFVVSLAASWAVCEAANVGDSFSMDRPPSEAPMFYSIFLGVVGLGAAVLLMGVNIIKLNVFIELMDGLLMPMAVGFLYLLATSELLPPEIRITGLRKWLTAAIFSVCTAVSLLSGIYGIVYGDELA